VSDPVTIGLIVAGAAGQAYSGYSTNMSAKREAGLIEDQGRLQQAENAAEAQRRADEIRKFSQKQSLAFMKNGVSLTGSPLLVTEDTVSEGQKEVNAIAKAGDARADLYNRKAAIVKNEGRAAFLGGVLGGASSAGSSYVDGKNAGLW
jgi:hypothetical protein